VRWNGAYHHVTKVGFFLRIKACNLNKVYIRILKYGAKMPSTCFEQLIKG